MTVQQPLVNTKLNILPFGTASISIRGGQDKVERKSEQRSQYIAPPTTNTEVEEIFFDGDNYYVPSTTGGNY